MIKTCTICKNTFRYWPYYTKKNRGFYCSKKCKGIAYSGENAYQWKGNKACRSPIHAWMKKHFGKPAFCEHCGKTDIPIQWANISSKYLRIRSDWKWLCIPCHVKFDAHLKPRGEKIKQSKLNKFQIQRMRLLKEIISEISYKKLGSLFGISKAQTYKIIHRQLWKHI